MATEYLKKPILTKKTELVKGSGFYAATCEMQGIFGVIQGGEAVWKMLCCLRK
jgi:hypothetical protein